MSHELRTPLNSLLILSDQLCQNRDGNLTGRQVEFAKTIHSSGNDLLTLINDILDLSKIESGTVNVDVSELRFDDLRHYVERTFRHVGESKNLDFLLRVDPRLPKSMVTDAKRLQQILKNLLSNAFKFTHEGQVTLSIEPARAGWHADNEDLNRAVEAVAFHVTDTGIGISNEKQQIIFEAFQQASGSGSARRKPRTAQRSGCGSGGGRCPQFGFCLRVLARRERHLPPGGRHLDHARAESVRSSCERGRHEKYFAGRKRNRAWRKSCTPVRSTPSSELRTA